jgi:hypothetical protein
MKTPAFLLTILLLVLLTPDLHAGRGWPRSKPTPKPAVHTTIASISSNSITVQEAKATKTFTITPDTEIDYNGQRVALSALQPGMRVSVNTGISGDVASRISANESPKEPAKPAGKK